MAEAYWISVQDSLPTHGDGVRVLMVDGDGMRTHGLGSRPLRPQDRAGMNQDGWKLWYFEGGRALNRLTVTHWMDLEPSSSFPPLRAES